MKTKKLPKMIVARELNKLIASEIRTHKTELRGQSGECRQWERGFIKGMHHARMLVGLLQQSHATS